jgi:hypothetical protein
MLGTPVAPILLAVVFGLLSVPIVAWSLVQAPADWVQDIVHAPLLGWSDAVTLALCSTVAASLVGGGLGGLLVRRHPVAATLLAIGTAWPVGIAMLSLVAATLGIGLRTGILCIDTCTPSITDQDPLSGLAASVGVVVGSAVFLIFPVAFAGLVAAGAFASRRGNVLVGSALVVAGYGALYFWSLLLGGGPAFVCLALGVVAWTVLLHQPRAEAITPAHTSASTSADAGGPEAEGGWPLQEASSEGQRGD